MKDEDALLKLCEEVNINDVENYLRMQPSKKFLHPAFSVTFRSKLDSMITLGQYIPHIGYNWLFPEVEHPFENLIFEEERLIHTLLINSEIFDDIIGFHLHGYENLRNGTYEIWEPLIEGEALFTLFLQEKKKNYLLPHTTLAYLKNRNPLHLWVAAKLIEIRNLLRVLKKREEEIVSETKTLYEYENISTAFKIIDNITSDISAFSETIGSLKILIIKYSMMTHQRPIEAIPLLIEKLKYLSRANPKEIGEFLTNLFTDLQYAKRVLLRRMLLILNILQMCLEHRNDRVKKDAMRALLCGVDSLTTLIISKKDKRISFVDPITDWLLTARDAYGFPVLRYAPFTDPSKAIKALEEHLKFYEAENSPFNITNLQKCGAITPMFIYLIEQKRIKYAKRLFSELAFPNLYIKKNGETLIEAGLKLIDSIVRIVATLSSAYKNEDTQKGTTSLLIKGIKYVNSFPENISVYVKRPVDVIYLKANKSAVRLLEEFDYNETKRALCSLLIEVITDYKFAETLIDEQIEPALQEVIGSIKEFELIPYLYLRI
ncbi:MAG: hypothetical protein QXG34_04035 [Candidatus Bathyarchaeia archaeon]